MQHLIFFILFINKLMMLLISFENSGPNIPEKIISKIFDPLFTIKQRGTGLGLVSCK
jgi:signal transduction histidine kinase